MNDRLRLLNATSSGDLRFEAPDVDLSHFDELPAELRWRIADANTKLAAGEFLVHAAWSVRKFGDARRTIAKIDEFELNEIAVFAGEFRGKYGAALPHVAADASVQRYGARGPSLHPPRRYGMPVIRRVKGRRR